MLSSPKSFKLNLADRVAIEKVFMPSENFQESTTNKYGLDKESAYKLYAQRCTQGVELVVNKIRQIKTNTITSVTIKQEFYKLLEQLASIRKDIAAETHSQEVDKFGRSRRDNPIIAEGIPLSVTTIDTAQHINLHNDIKNVLIRYLPSLLKADVSTERTQQIIIPDSGSVPRSRYVITRYLQSYISYYHVKNPQVILKAPVANNMPFIMKIAQDSNYQIHLPHYNCSEEIFETFETLIKRDPDSDKQSIIVGEIQININGHYITGTRHITWFNETITEFKNESRIMLLHTPQENIDSFLDKAAEIWLKAIMWDENNNNLNDLKQILADLLLHSAQALLYYRGSPTIFKMLMVGTMVAHQFLPSETVSAVDEYCTAENFPFANLFSIKYEQCFAKPFLSNRTKEYHLQHESLLKQEEISTMAKNSM